MKQIVTALFVLALLAGCGSHSNTAAVKPTGVSISCMDMNTTGICSNHPLAKLGMFDFLPGFESTALASDLTVTTTFQAGDQSISTRGAAVVITMAITNNDPTTFTGYLIGHLMIGGFDLGLVGEPIALASGETTTFSAGSGLSVGMTQGPGSQSLYLYATHDPDFTIADSNAWTGSQIMDWVNTNNPIPAAVGTVEYNIVP